jgi:hypothetical protein
LDFLWKEGRKEGRSVFPTRSCRLLVGNTFPILSVISNAFSISLFTLLYSEEMFKIPALHILKQMQFILISSNIFGSPSRVQSPVSLSLSIFREFICALNRNAIKIKDPNFKFSRPQLSLVRTK